MGAPCLRHQRQSRPLITKSPRKRAMSPTVSSQTMLPGAEVTLHRIMLHVVVDTQRHAGHADIVREFIDGATGLLPGNDNMDNMPARDQAGWAERRNQVEQAARAAGR
jgi:hypothetical protein